MGDEERKVQKGDVIENVIVKEIIHQEFTINSTATKIPAPPSAAKVMIFHNDSGVQVRYGQSDVAYGAADPRRGFPVENNRGFSIGIADGRAKEIWFIADADGRKAIIGWGI